MFLWATWSEGEELSVLYSDCKARVRQVNNSYPLNAIDKIPDPLDLLKSRFGYEEFWPLQGEIIDNVLAGRDSLALMPTGGGKSLCYQLPALMFSGVTLVVSPLIALMKDQVDALNANGIPARYINSSLSGGEIEQVQREVKAGQSKLLYVAPERLPGPGFRRFLMDVELSLIAVDEAHCISEWGHEFRPDYRNMVDLRRDFPNVPVIALTATATERVRDDIIEQLELQRGRVFRSSFNRANLTYSVRPKADCWRELVSLLEKRRDQASIIYCFSRQETEDVAARLNKAGFSAATYHAGLDAGARRRAQDDFIRDRAPIIVATIAFGMGIDKPDVRLVVHYSMPKSVEGYYQETGRAGRDGLPSRCVLFFSPGDRARQDYFIRRIQDDAEWRHAREKLYRMVDYAQITTCRRRYLLEYFGEEWGEGNCGACDVCLEPGREFDGTEIAQKVLSAVVKTEERFGANHVINVLVGSREKRVIRSGHDRLSVYGIVEEFSREQLKEIIAQLRAKGLLVRNEGELPTLSVSAVGWEALRGREKVTLVKPAEAAKATRASARGAMTQYDTGLFEELRVLRRRLAEERNVPPYVVFGDASLRHMAAAYPRSRDEFARMYGVGETKMDEYGPEFVETIKDYVEAKGITVPAGPVPLFRGEGRRGASAHDGALRGTHERTRELVEQGMTLEEIAGNRGLGRSTVIGHLEHIVRQGIQLDLTHLRLDGERFARIAQAFRESGGWFLAPVKELLGDDYDYEELKLARLQLLQTGPHPDA